MRAALQSSGPPSPGSSAPRGRHRFVQDGEVPVVVVNGHRRAPEEGRAALTALEHTLELERAARAASEKALMQAEETIRQLRTRLAHAELAREERVREDTAREEAARVEAAAPPPATEAPASVPAPKRGRRPKAEASPAAEPDVEGEAIEWWRPGWKERLRQAG